MHCPFCQNPDTKVIDTRISDDGYSIRRRRVCPKCNKRFTTVETSMLLVTKRSGGAEPFPAVVLLLPVSPDSFPKDY